MTKKKTSRPVKTAKPDPSALTPVEEVARWSGDTHSLHSTPGNDGIYPKLWPEDSLEAIVANAFAIGMIQADSEASEFAEFVSKTKPRVIVALGTLCGGMDYLMNRMAKPDLQISVDRAWPERDPKPRWPPDLLKREMPDLVWITGEIHAADTLDAVKSVLGGRLIDLLFIDADHSKEGSLTHFRMYAPLVKPGGWVGFHDVRNGWGCGATFDELAKSHEHQVIVYPPAPFGIGLIRV